MGNSIVKGDAEESSAGDPPSVAHIPPRKHSTVSSARLLLCGERIEYLTEEQKGHIRLCWKKIENDVAQVGVITFIQ